MDPIAGVAIAGILGDQQAALVGQTCFDAGEAKNTYGTGCFLLMNTGTEIVPSRAGLITTVAYRFGDEPASYALEGSIAITGALVQWLRDSLKIIETSAEVEALAREVDDNGGVYFVPAFSGLYAPHWNARRARRDARAHALRHARAHRTRGARGHGLPGARGAGIDAARRGRFVSRAARRWRHGAQRTADAVPGGYPREHGGLHRA